MNTPLLSICIPTRNRPKLLADLLRSYLLITLTKTHRFVMKSRSSYRIIIRHAQHLRPSINTFLAIVITTIIAILKTLEGRAIYNNAYPWLVVDTFGG